MVLRPPDRPPAGHSSIEGLTFNLGQPQRTLHQRRPLNSLTEARTAPYHLTPQSAHFHFVCLGSDRFYPLFMSGFPFYSVCFRRLDCPTQHSWLTMFCTGIPVPSCCRILVTFFQFRFVLYPLYLFIYCHLSPRF